MGGSRDGWRDGVDSLDALDTADSPDSTAADYCPQRSASNRGFSG